MPELVVLFDFERRDPKQYPENERYGEGSIRISTDKEPETEEDFKEIAKAIFRNGQYNAVAVKSVFYDDNGLFSALEKPIPVSRDRKHSVNNKPENEVLQGEVVDE